MSANERQPLVLHAHSTGPNPYKIAIALEFLAIPYKVKVWDFSAEPSGVKGNAFASINPNGRVPALEDPNTSVTSWESGACLNYLLRTYDKNGLLGPLGDSEQSRVDFDKWIFFLVSTLGPMMGQVNWFRHYHTSTNADALKRYEEQSYRCFGVLEEQLKKSGGSWILGPGKTPSAVDLHFYPWVKQYEFAGLSLDSYPAIAKWFQTVSGLGEVKRGYEKIPQGELA